MSRFSSAPDPRLDAVLNAGDDIVQTFEVKPLGVRGRVVRFGTAVDGILRQHDYPEPVSALLAQAVGLGALLGSALKFDGKFILQTRSDGPVSMLVADYATPGQVRGYAQFDAAAVEGLMARERPVRAAKLLGRGHLAMTVDQGSDMERYQGIVALDGNGLEGAAHEYFERSEQIPTRLRLTAGPLVGRGAEPAESWRAGAIMVQHLPREGGASPLAVSSGDAPEGHRETVIEDDRWVKARLLLETVEDHELLDPTLAPAQLLYRLYHEDGVTVYPPHHVARHCTCSRARAERIVAHYGADELNDMLEDGRVVVTCQFCSARYEFDPDELGSGLGRRP
jgi:molecular chaperone Hsp33